MLEPEEDPICKCRYDEGRDGMDREDCPFHCDLVDGAGGVEAPEVERKRPAPTVAIRRENANSASLWSCRVSDRTRRPFR